MENILSMQPKQIRGEDLIIGQVYLNIQDGLGEFRGICDYDGKNVYAFQFGKIHGITQTLYMKEEELVNLRNYNTENKKKVRLTKLRTMDWFNTLSKAKEKINNDAEQLVDLYAKRQHIKGILFPQDDYRQEKFEQSFEFELSPSQKNAINKIKNQMNEGRIIDMLVAGDVASGKTAVAMCIAFKCVIRHYQIVFLAGSTILAEQHYHNFIEQFKNYPEINIGLLTSGITKSKKQIIQQNIADGSIDIIIGTQSVLRDDVVFNNLSCIIIDESHLIGAKDKEKLKMKYNNIASIYMSATHIPRDLFLARLKLRDFVKLESITTKKAIITEVIQGWDKDKIKPYVNNEIASQGQIFVMLNDISQLEEMKNKMLDINNNLKIKIIHGKMKKKEVSAIMDQFNKNEFNVLVSTSIISVGISIPNANLIIIYSANKLGLSMSHQMKGRVNRGNKQGCCLFVTDSNNISDIARKRLMALKTRDNLGGGLLLAEDDAKLRGSGTALNSKQSGFFDSMNLGKDYFLEVLEQSIQNKKSEKGIN